MRDHHSACHHFARPPLAIVMAGLDPAIHAAPLETPYGRPCERMAVDGRDKPGHDGWKKRLYWALRASGSIGAALARRLDWNRGFVDRLFRLDRRSRLEQLEVALKALREVDRADQLSKLTA